MMSGRTEEDEARRKEGSGNKMDEDKITAVTESKEIEERRTQLGSRSGRGENDKEEKRKEGSGRNRDKDMIAIRKTELRKWKARRTDD